MKVLAADDSITSLALLEGLLTGWGYEVVSASSGTEAQELLQGDDSPRLALLDWMMPGISGAELCRQLRDRTEGPFVYTILVTGRAEKQDLLEGLDSGAHDFLSKPFDADELRSRVAVGVRIVEYESALAEKNRQLARYATEMEVLAGERARQLVHADRMVTLGIMTAGIAHEINNPAAFINGNLSTIEMYWSQIEPCITACLERGQERAGNLDLILEEMPKMVKAMRAGMERIGNIVRRLKSYAHRDREKPALCQINKCVVNALALCANVLKNRVTVETDLDEATPPVLAHEQQIEQVLINLFVNAADAMSGQAEAGLRITSKKEGDGARIVVEDSGPGIPSDAMDRIWDPFWTTKEAGRGTGLGLSISRGIVGEHGGTIHAANRPEGGARFVIDLPIGRAPRTRAAGNRGPNGDQGGNL